jgi:hypothetical protein
MTTTRALFLAVIALLVAGCSSDRNMPPPNPTPTTTPPAASATPLPSPKASRPAFALVTIETRGGHCRTGPCGRLVNIEGDGRIHEVIPTDRVTGQVPQPLLDALRTEIEQANYPLLQSRPFTGDCPTAYDGQETVYTFHAPSGDEELASCTVAIDENHPLFLAVAATLALETP